MKGKTEEKKEEKKDGLKDGEEKKEDKKEEKKDKGKKDILNKPDGMTTKCIKLAPLRLHYQTAIKEDKVEIC